IYQNFSSPRGLALIINNYRFLNKQNREGTQIDEINLYNLFKQFGYKIICERDLTAKQMCITIQKFAEREEHLKCDSAIVVVMSHGEFDNLLGTDEMPVNFYSFVSCLNSKNAPKLIGKPKIFIVQACRGADFDLGVQHISEEFVDGPSFSPLFSIFSKYIKPNNNNPLNASSIFRNAPLPNSQNYSNESQEKRSPKLKIELVPTFADILIASSTTSYHVSWRNSSTGSWFIQTLCEVFSKRAKNDDILKMLTQVKSEVAKREANADRKYKQVKY
uniref:CASPASE_P20 domain-containing protein n=1 Tax=Meloidogyne hapla TaxID=6305 RepID=A0A1I8BBK7_MELHA